MAERSPCPAWLLVAAALTCAGAAHAEAPDPLETARRLFREASELEAARSWSAAAGKLREALAIKDTPGLRFHLAHCEEQSGELVEAERDYERATELIQGGAPAPDVEKLLPDALAALKPRIASLLVVLPQGTQGAQLAVDGRAVEPFTGQPLPLDPKEHRVVITLGNGLRSEQRLTLAEGEQRTLAIDPAALAPPAKAPVAAENRPVFRPEPAVSVAPRATPARTYAIVGESVLTLAGVSLGVVYALARSSDTNRATDAQRRVSDAAMGDRAACATPTGSLAGPCHDFNAALDARQRDGTIETVGFVTAGVSASALVASLLFWPARKSTERSLRYQPWLGKGAVGFRANF